MEHYGDLITAEITKAAGKLCRCLIEVSETDRVPNNNFSEDFQLPLPNMNPRPYNGRLLRKDFTFDHFVVGGNNDFAYSASLSMASKKIVCPMHYYYLKPNGKKPSFTAMGHYMLTEHPLDRVYYMTAEDFSNEMVYAFRHDSINAFKGKYRDQCDVLLLEDVHQLSGKERTQIELAITLDTMFESHKKIILSSCCLPGEIPKLNDKLRSRLSGSLISNIDPPDFKTRVRILEKKAKLNGCQMPENVIDYLASELTEDVRRLESGLIGITAKSSLLGMPVDIGLAESVVKNIIRNRENITIDTIKKLVCKYYTISVKEIVSSSRKQAIVRARQIAIYLSRKYTDAPLQAIGKSFNRYHATAIHSIGAVERALKENGPIQKQVEFLCDKLESGKI